MREAPNPFKKAVLENEYTLTAFCGPTGSGKTLSAIRYATGLVDGTGKRIAFIDTERGRATHYAKKFDYDHAEIDAPFTTDRLFELILAGENANYGVIIIDSASHLYVGEGGLQDQADETLVRMCTDERGNFDAKKAERLTALAWKDPKIRWKKFMTRLLQRKVHLIFCLRAEERIAFKKTKFTGSNGKEYEKNEVVQLGFVPVAEKSFCYEMSMVVMFNSTTPGVPSFMKIEGDFKAAFEGERQVDEAAGRFMRDWSMGKAPNHIVGPNKKVAEADTKIDKKNADPIPPKAEVPEKKEEKPPVEQSAGAGKLMGEGPYKIITSSKGDGHATEEIEIWRNGILSQIERSPSLKHLDAFLSFNGEHIQFVLDEGNGAVFAAVQKAITARRQQLSKGKT